MRPALLASALAGAVACSDARWVFDSTVDAGAPTNDAARTFDAHGGFGFPHEPDATLPFDAGGVPDIDFDASRGFGSGFPRCVTSQDCVHRSLALYCNSMNQCVECTADQQCGWELPVCDLAINRCVECNARGGCQPGEICLPMVHQCVVPCDGGPSECAPDTPYCVMQEGFCRGCVSDQYCNNSSVGHICSPAGRCVDCFEDSQCRDPSAPRCNTATNQCVQCVTSTDCVGSQLCDPNSYTCVGF